MRPPWNPNWDDVRFDHLAVSDAVHESLRLARLLDEVAAGDAATAKAACEDWAGRYRDEFDDGFHAVQSQRTALAADLRRFVERLRSATEEARLEQRRREDQREQWYSEARRLEAATRAREAAE